MASFEAPKSSRQESAWLTHAKELAASGVYDKLAKFTTVRVLRSDGSWQEGATMDMVRADAGVIQVSWPHPNKPGKRLGKTVDAEDLLNWQNPDFKKAA